MKGRSSAGMLASLALGCLLGLFVALLPSCASPAYAAGSTGAVPFAPGEPGLKGTGPAVDPSSEAAVPSGLVAFHRSGQTFLTWPERVDLQGERYRVYRSARPITSQNLPQATLLYTVPEGSARFYANRYADWGGAWHDRYLARYVIQDNGSELAEGTGLLVWTLAPQDFGGAAQGQGYYAVTVTPAGGGEIWLDATAAPLAEAVADPLPVEVEKNVGSGGHLYIQYMDLRAWNPTFHAPNKYNQYYGLDKDPLIGGALQYAYDYTVFTPSTATCGATLPAALPVFLNLHPRYGINNYYPVTAPPNPSWCAYGIYPVDEGETWYFGFARGYDFRLGGAPAAGDTVVNYTEWRILRMIYDLLRQPPGPAADPRRVYVFGHSMGGSGALSFAMRYPNVFAAAYASEPVTDYATAGWIAGDVQPKWGAPALNLPVALAGPGNWAAGLAAYNGTGVWDWQDHQANLTARAGDQKVPLGIVHGRLDTQMTWSAQGRPAYPALTAGRAAWGAAIVNDGHFDFVARGMPGLPPDLAWGAGGPFAGFRAVLNESVPGLGNDSGSLPVPPPDAGDAGGYNQALSWSASWDAWDAAPVDVPWMWRISLRATDGVSHTVDVTPRRLQMFRVIPGATYRWENRRVSDNALVASGTVVAGDDGLVTVPGVAVSPGGSRLLLRDPTVSVNDAFLPILIRR